MGWVAGVLSFLVLLNHAMNEDFATPLRYILDAYEGLTTVFLGWLEPIVYEILRELSIYGDLDDAWRDTFVLFWMYTIAIAKTAWDRKFYGNFVFRVTWGALVGLTVSISLGVVTSGVENSAIWMTSIAAIGFVIFSIGNAVWSVLFVRLQTGKTRVQQLSINMTKNVVPLAILGGAVVSVAVLLDAVSMGTVRNQLGVLLLLAFVPGLALVRLIEGALEANLQVQRRENEGWWAEFRRADSTRIATGLISIVIGVSLAVLSDALGQLAY